MLVLSRKTGEAIMIGDDIRITVVSLQGNRVRLGIVAPETTSVDRHEIYEKKQARIDSNSPLEEAALPLT